MENFERVTSNETAGTVDTENSICNTETKSKTSQKRKAREIKTKGKRCKLNPETDIPLTEDTQISETSGHGISKTERCEVLEIKILEKKPTTTKKKNSKKTKARRKRSKTCSSKFEISDDICSICSKRYMDGENWICCDACGVWYHQTCLCLDDRDLEYFSNTDAVYVCPICR